MNKIKKFFKNLFKTNPKVELYKDEDGYYIVKCYGQWMTNSLTKDEQEAQRYFKYIKECTEGLHEQNPQLVKSS